MECLIETLISICIFWFLINFEILIAVFIGEWMKHWTLGIYEVSLYQTMEWHVMGAQGGGCKVPLSAHHDFIPHFSEIVQWILSSSHWDKDCRMYMGCVRTFLHPTMQLQPLSCCYLPYFPCQPKKQFCRHSLNMFFGILLA